MIVVPHQAVGVQNPFADENRAIENLQEPVSIIAVPEYKMPSVPPRRYVINSAGKLDPQRSRHGPLPPKTNGVL